MTLRLRRLAIALVILIVLLLPCVASSQTPPPVLFFSDLDSAANAGSESVSGFAGMYVTLYGNFFGASQGSSTITWNGLNCLRVLPSIGAYTGWGMAHLWYQEVIVQLGSSCTPGTGNFVVMTPSGVSNGLPFTVRSTGNTYCISTTGSDSNTGLLSTNSCFATGKFAFTKMSPGDTTYWKGGVTISSGGGFSAMDWGASGTAGNPVAMVAYPGASPQPGVTCNPCTDGYAIRAAQGFPATQVYLTMAGLKVSGDTFAWFSEYGGNNQRIIANLLTCTGPSAAVGCFETSQQTFIQFMGNEVTGIVASPTQKQYHDVYFSTDTNHIEEAWNAIHDNNSCTGTQFHSSPFGSTPNGFDQYDIKVHDNHIWNEPCSGLLLATVDPSQSAGVQVYNNVIWHVGAGPPPSDSEESQCGIRFANIINDSPPNPAGTAEVYNNTLVDNGSYVGTFGHSGAICIDTNGTANIGIDFRNNIGWQTTGEYWYNSGGGVPSGPGLALSGSNNIWHGGNPAQAPPSWTTGNITADPLFVNESTSNFALQAASPARGAGTPITSSVLYNNNVPWESRSPYDSIGVNRPATPAIGALDSGPPTFIWSTAVPVAVPSGSNWGGNSPCGTNVVCYRIPLPEPTIAGATLVMAFGYDSTSSNQVFTVVDNKSNTWVLDVTSSASNNKTMRMYRAANVAAGTTFITVTLTGGAQNGYWNALIGEFYNAGALDVSSCSTGSGTSIGAGSLTPTLTGDLIFQAKYSASLTQQTATFTQGSQSSISWALATQLLGDGSAFQYGVYNSTAAISPTFTQAATDSYISCAVALQAASTGSAPTAVPRVIHQEHDAMPKNSANPWKVGIVVDTPNSAVYLSYVGNDSISSVTSSPSPTVGWTASGADFNGLNGHNHLNYYCASWTGPPGTVVLSITRSGTSNDSINMMYVVQNGTCNLDVDSGGQASSQGSIGPLTVCTNCLTPTKQNDFIMTNGGQAFCTATSLSAPGGGNFDSAWFTGNTIDGPTQTDENNYWAHYYNGSSLSGFTVTFGEACDFAQGDWASRTAAYQSFVAATAPAVSLSPTSLSYGNQSVGVTSSPQTVTLTNTGTATLTISSIALTGTNPGDFAISSNTCGASLGVGSNCAVSVTFTPTTTGARAANLTFTTNASTSPDNAALSGTGQSAPIASFSPTSITFNGVLVEHTSATQSTTLTNTGNSTMTISSISITGTNGSSFSQTSTCGATLAANASCAITVTFKPTATGVLSASVSVSSNATGSPNTVPLTGTGFTSVSGTGTLSGSGTITTQP